MNICIFEDNTTDYFYPLALTRPIFDLRCGTMTLAERIIRYIPRSSVYFHTRSILLPILRQSKRRVITNTIKQCVFINSRVIADTKFINTITRDGVDTLFVDKQKNVLAASLTAASIRAIMQNGDAPDWSSLRIKRRIIPATTVQYLWDLVVHNQQFISNDFAAWHRAHSNQGTINSGAHVINRENIFIDKQSHVKVGTVIDAERGPVIIDERVTVEPNCVIQGPAYIGPGSTINPGAKILAGTSIGPVSKIGGEVSQSIIQGYSNKQHHGYLGNAYIGEWCNLGAGTSNSDLKNNYGPIAIQLKEKAFQTKEVHLGLFMGDHCKSGINTMFNSGTVVGLGSNVFGAGFLPKHVPSFTWLEAGKDPKRYRWDKFIATAQTVMKRRDCKLSTPEQTLLKRFA